MTDSFRGIAQRPRLLSEYDTASAEALATPVHRRRGCDRSKVGVNFDLGKVSLREKIQVE